MIGHVGDVVEGMVESGVKYCKDLRVSKAERLMMRLSSASLV